jgi:hypothetical protein
MSAESILKVTSAIKARIDTALINDAGDPNISPVFVGPLDDVRAKDASLVLFLYRIIANQNLRNAEHTVSVQAAIPGDQAYQTYANALALDLHFILTVSPKDKADELESLRFLGYAMRSLNDSPILVGAQVGGETVRLSLDAVSTEEISRVWSLFPTVNYRTSVLYLASPVWIDPALPPNQAAEVVDQGVLAGQGG